MQVKHVPVLTFAAVLLPKPRVLAICAFTPLVLQYQIDTFGKTDPPEIERTYNIRNQQTRFYCVCLFMITNGKCNNSHASADKNIHFPHVEILSKHSNKYVYIASK